MFKETLGANEADGIFKGTKAKLPENMFLLKLIFLLYNNNANIKRVAQYINKSDIFKLLISYIKHLEKQNLIVILCIKS